MSRALRIDFVSDVSCPWCIIGLRGLEQALERLDGTVTADIHFQPFELNPDMAPEGESIADHLARKMGATPEQLAESRKMITDRAAQVGFTMALSEDRRIYNTFDAHRLLHWAKNTGHQQALKNALFTAYFTQGQSPADPDVLAAAAEQAGLDGVEARQILESGQYAGDVRKAEQMWRSRGIDSVPAVIVEGRYLISGGQPPEAFEQALRQIASETA